ncbi:hypothetical protein NUW54_g13640 [Trametes sanguinea]|uniref:Uncharacterized protein n=1 Tax=Trametes sanguinea TaxID=158606 RepID=A0ACC1MJ09_9APHY|nr:hypothetical protein NUW54_g13640 [Trametes sanguinea]
MAAPTIKQETPLATTPRRIMEKQYQSFHFAHKPQPASDASMGTSAGKSPNPRRRRGIKVEGGAWSRFTTVTKWGTEVL